MVKIETNSSDVNLVADDEKHRHPEIEHFLNLNTILHSLVDFIRPETYVAQDELQTYNELKEKFLRESANKRAKKSLEIAGVQSIRSTSGIYRFLAHHHSRKKRSFLPIRLSHLETNASTNSKKQKTTTPVVASREELLKKLHEKMPHRQQQAGRYRLVSILCSRIFLENGEDRAAKRQRSKDKSQEPKKRPKPPVKEWKPTPTDTEKTPSPTAKSSTVPNQITFGRFEFKSEDGVDLDSKKKKKGKRLPTKQKQLINTLKQVENDQSEIKRLNAENPAEGKALARAKNWQTALAKAKGEKVRDNAQLLRKSIKKQAKIRQRSAKKWKQNKVETDKRMKERQDKRQTNLQKRKDEKKAKIKKRLIKKGRLIS